MEMKIFCLSIFGLKPCKMLMAELLVWVCKEEEVERKRVKIWKMSMIGLPESLGSGDLVQRLGLLGL